MFDGYFFWMNYISLFKYDPLLAKLSFVHNLDITNVIAVCNLSSESRSTVWKRVEIYQRYIKTQVQNKLTMSRRKRIPKRQTTIGKHNLDNCGLIITNPTKRVGEGGSRVIRRERISYFTPYRVSKLVKLWIQCQLELT